MRNSARALACALTSIAIIGASASIPAAAQQALPASTITTLLKQALADYPGHEVIMLTIDIPPGQTVELKPGQLHMMLVGLKAPLKAGDMLPLTLRFEKAGDVKVDLKVEENAPAGMPASSAHQH